MARDYVIEVENVKKKFKVYNDKGNTMKERVTSWTRNKYEIKWVLNGISFKVKRGESVGLIGQNGCGKSTTLKLLTRIMYPSSGDVKINGRVSSLLELGAGFHPDMTGIENIYINASIFGLSRKEIDERLKDIIDFAELGDYIFNPVRTYSSGMYMRLAFAVAINVDADILLVDEILAVGDVNFQTKCFNKLMDIKRAGTTIVLVSHSTEQIERVCERSIWLQDGLIRMDGSPREVHKEYLKFMGESRREVINDDREAETQSTEECGKTENKKDDVSELYNRRGTGEARITKVSTMNEVGTAQEVFELGETVRFKVNYNVYKKISGVYFGLSIFRSDGALCYGTNMAVEGMELIDLEKDGSFVLSFNQSQLMQGKYYVDVCIAIGADEMIDYCDTVAPFEVFQVNKEVGTFSMPHEWKIADNMGGE